MPQLFTEFAITDHMECAKAKSFEIPNKQPRQRVRSYSAAGVTAESVTGHDFIFGSHSPQCLHRRPLSDYRAAHSANVAALAYAIQSRPPECSARARTYVTNNIFGSFVLAQSL